MEFIVPNTSRETKIIIFELINRKSTSGTTYIEYAISNGNLQILRINKDHIKLKFSCKINSLCM